MRAESPSQVDSGGVSLAFIAFILVTLVRKRVAGRMTKTPQAFCEGIILAVLLDQ